MKEILLPGMRYGKNAAGLYDTLSCHEALRPYISVIQNVAFQWKAGEQEHYSPVWFLQVLPDADLGLLMRFSDAGTEGDLQRRPHTLLQEVALCNRREHLALLNAIASGHVPDNECKGTEWQFALDDTAPATAECWHTAPLQGALPESCILTNGNTPVEDCAPATSRATVPAPHKKGRKGSCLFGISVAANILLIVFLVVTVMASVEYVEDTRQKNVSLNDENEQLKQTYQNALNEETGKKQELKNAIEELKNTIKKLEEAKRAAEGIVRALEQQVEQKK